MQDTTRIRKLITYFESFHENKIVVGGNVLVLSFVYLVLECKLYSITKQYFYVRSGRETENGGDSVLILDPSR